MSDLNFNLICGDAYTKLMELKDQSINCVVTSPPYWGLRDCGMPGQLGLEKTINEFTCNLVGVFQRIHRVLRDDGTVWLNLGDSYHRLKPKNLVGVPWRVAFELQRYGWYLRSDIIWNKPNPMPESIVDRPTRAHEYIFLLTKSPRYYYDAAAIREPARQSSLVRWAQDVENQEGSLRGNGGTKANGTMKAVGGGQKKIPRGWANSPNYESWDPLYPRRNKQRGHVRRHSGFNDRWDQLSREDQMAIGSNKRSVWTVATQPYRESHFATFPEKLIEPCIRAGCPTGGTVLDPFMGSGTTGVVSIKLSRNFVGIDLNPSYVEMSRRRIEIIAPLFSNPA